MMSNRFYFKTTDPKVIKKAIEYAIDSDKLCRDARILATEFGSEPMYQRSAWTLGMSFAGLHMSLKEWAEKKENWSKPSNGCSNVKKTAKDKALYKAYTKAFEKIKEASPCAMFDVLGFDPSDYLISGGMAYRFKQKNDYVLFNLPQEWPEKSPIQAEELTTSQYKALSK